jgi:hypothetical protein
MYAQYRCVDASLCLELPEGTAAADGASSFVNPMTVLGMVETMRRESHSALVHTAAASNLGQMLNRLCIAEQIPLVSIVRRQEHEELLRSAGATHVCNSTSPAFTDELTAALTATAATLAFDATGGGRLASQILTCMEAVASAAAGSYSRYGSTVHKQVYIYGSLDRGPTELTRNFGMAWGIGGWLLTSFLQQIGPEDVARLRRRVAGEHHHLREQLHRPGIASRRPPARHHRCLRPAGYRVEISHHPQPLSRGPRHARITGVAGSVHDERRNQAGHDRAPGGPASGCGARECLAGGVARGRR